MNEYILSFLDYVSLDQLVIASILFSLTMFIKKPIKHITSKFKDTKRKAINSVIILIPIALSTIINTLYYLLLKKTFIAYEIITSITNSWLISLSIYAIYQRVKIIIKAYLEGKQDISLIKENKELIKNEVIDLLTSIDNCKKILKETNSKINNLLKQKNKNINITTLFQTNIELEALNKKEKTISNKLHELTNKLDTLKEEDIKYDI